MPPITVINTLQKVLNPSLNLWYNDKKNYQGKFFLCIKLEPVRKWGVFFLFFFEIEPIFWHIPTDQFQGFKNRKLSNFIHLRNVLPRILKLQSMWWFFLSFGTWWCNYNAYVQEDGGKKFYLRLSDNKKHLMESVIYHFPLLVHWLLPGRTFQDFKVPNAPHHRISRSRETSITLF